MAGYIKLKKGLKDDCNLVVPDDVARQIKLTKWGNADQSIKPCDPSKLLDLGETFCGTYRDVLNVWVEKDRKDAESQPPLTPKEREENLRRLEKFKPDWMKGKPKLATVEELKKSEEELKEVKS